MAKGIDAKLDKAWSQTVQIRAGMKCERCGKMKYLNSHHIVGRRNKSTRWEITNGCCLCAGCHTFSSSFSAHQTPTIFAEWIIGERGQEWHDDLISQANTIKKWTKHDKEELFKQMKEGLENETKV